MAEFHRWRSSTDDGVPPMAELMAEFHRCGVPLTLSEKAEFHRELSKNIPEHVHPGEPTFRLMNPEEPTVRIFLPVKIWIGVLTESSLLSGFKQTARRVQKPAKGPRGHTNTNKGLVYVNANMLEYQKCKHL